MTEQQQAHLHEENQRLKQELHEECRFNHSPCDEAYATDSQRLLALMYLRIAQCKEEMLREYLDRKSAHLQAAQDRLAVRVHVLAERTRREMRRLDTSIKNAVAALEPFDDSNEPDR
jgi:hypothetical protein